MAFKIILCSDCGSKNRIPEDKSKGKAVCGSCGKQLAVKGNRGSFLSWLFSIIIKLWFVWVLGFIFIALPYLEDRGTKSSSNSSSSIRKISANKDLILDSGILLAAGGEEIAPIQMKHGVIKKNFSEGFAPLEIKTSAGSNYYIKIVDTSNNKTALTAYVVGGRTFEVQMPLGTFELRYAAGDAWYGIQHYFGPSTAFSKTNELFYFTSNGYQYSGYTVELIMQVHGNLRTIHIDEADF